MKTFLLFISFLAISTNLWAGPAVVFQQVVYLPQPAVAPVVNVYYQSPKPKPLVTSDCVRIGSFDRCREYNYVYSVAGAQCEADCLVFNSFDRCKLRNGCEYDSDSGCFLKRTCLEINSFNHCEEWEEEAVCGG